MMVLNQYYEVAVKKAVSRHYDLREKVAICHKNIHHYHQIKEQDPTIKIPLEELANLKMTLKEKDIIHEDTRFRERANPKILAIYLKSEMGRGATNKLRRVSARIILLIQAYNLNKKVQRSKRSKVDLGKLIKFYEEEYCISESESVNPEEFESNDALSQVDKVSMISKNKKMIATESGNLNLIGKAKAEEDSKNEAEREFDEFEDELSSNEGEEKTIYDRINER